MKKCILLLVLAGVSCSNGTDTYSIVPTTTPITGCTVTQTSISTIISCPDGSIATIPTLLEPISPVGIITPCGSQSSPWKEVLICLSDGDLLSSFSETMGGQDTRLAIIPDGNYIDTDESGCNFTVTSSSFNRTVSWNAGSNQYSTWTVSSNSCAIND